MALQLQLRALQLQLSDLLQLSALQLEALQLWAVSEELSSAEEELSSALQLQLLPSEVAEELLEQQTYVLR